MSGRAQGARAILGLSAVLGLSLLLTPITAASASPGRHRAAAVPAHKRALEAYRRAREQDRHRRHERHRAGPSAPTAVVGGTLDSIEAVPWQVAIFAEFEVSGKKGILLCGGSIVDLSHIVTAAHCAFDPVTEKPLAPTSFVVVAGASTITEKEIKEGATVQARLVEGVRIHPYFEYASLEGADDVAALQLAQPLKATAAVKPIAVSSSSSSPPEGANVSLSGYGEENPITEELDEKLYSIGMTLRFSRQCGRAADALLLCGSTPGGSACNGDSGGGVIEASPPTLIGVVDFGEGEQRCEYGSVNGFANLTAPEVRDFIEGNDAPPHAPRGGGVVIRGVTTVGRSLTCEPGSWSNAPTFTYAFINKATGQVLQQGSSPTYLLSEADVGRTIYCEVYAANAGGTGVGRTGALAPVKTAPVFGPFGSPPSPAPAVGVPPQESASAGLAGTPTFSSAQIAALLRQELTPAGRAARIATLLKTGRFTIRFQALEAGTARIEWYELPAGAKLAKRTKVKPMLVASGRASFSAAGTEAIKIRLTAAGRRLLGSSRSVKLTAKGTFTPSGEGPVTVAKVFLLKR